MTTEDAGSFRTWRAQYLIAAAKRLDDQAAGLKQQAADLRATAKRLEEINRGEVTHHPDGHIVT